MGVILLTRKVRLMISKFDLSSTARVERRISASKPDLPATRGKEKDLPIVD